jgi:hypothetical protein
MKLAMVGFAALVWTVGEPAFATRSWSGFLVNSDCYEALERNANPWDTSIYVDRDRDWEIRYCRPNHKTKSFALVDHDGSIFRLDPAVNSKAAEIVQNAAKKEFLAVTVTGEMKKDEIAVSGISQDK